MFKQRTYEISFYTLVNWKAPFFYAGLILLKVKKKIKEK